MINYMQSNQNMIHNQRVIDLDIWNTLTEILQQDGTYLSAGEYLENVSRQYNIEIKNIIKDYLNYIIRHRSEYVCKDFLNFAEFIMHLHDPKIEYIKNYSVVRLHSIFSLVA